MSFSSPSKQHAFKLTGRSENTGLNALRSPIFPNGPVRCALCVDDLCFIGGRNGKRQKPSALSHYDSLFAGFRTAKGSVEFTISTKISHARNRRALVAEEMTVGRTGHFVCRSFTFK